MNQPKINIAIDGYSSCGKGTLAKHLSKWLGYKFIDSGAMYRAVTLACLQAKVDPENEEELIFLLSSLKIDFHYTDPDGRSEVWLNNENVESQIRTLRVAELVSKVAEISSVRAFLVNMQKSMGKDKGVVMDGRDIGTVVLPKAELKIFMTARPEIRAQRRFKEMQSAGIHVTYQEVLDNLKERDFIDSTRKDSPLTLTADYKVLDNSDLTKLDQQKIAENWVLELINKDD